MKAFSPKPKVKGLNQGKKKEEKPPLSFLYWTKTYENQRRKKLNSLNKPKNLIPNSFLRRKDDIIEEMKCRGEGSIPTQRSFQKYVSFPSPTTQKTRWEKEGR